MVHLGFPARVVVTATSKPARASASALAAPTPYEAPVTSAVRRATIPSCGPFRFRWRSGPNAALIAHKKNKAPGGQLMLRLRPFFVAALPLGSAPSALAPAALAPTKVRRG